MNRCERGRTCGVNSEAWAIQVEEIGKPIGVRPEMRMGPSKLALQMRFSVVPLIVRIHHAHKDTHLMIQTSQFLPRISCIFQSGPGGLEKNPLLRIHCFCLQRRNVEKQRIELVDVIDKAAPPGINSSGFLRIGFLQSLPIPTIRWDFASAVTSLFQVLPEFLDISRPGIPSGNANDSDRFLILSLLSTG